MAYHSFIPKRAFGDLMHVEYPCVMQPYPRHKTGGAGRGAAGKLSGDRNGHTGPGMTVRAVQLGSYLPDGNSRGVQSRDEHCVEPGCSTRLSRYNRGSVCAGCSTRDADRTHR